MMIQSISIQTYIIINISVGELEPGSGTVLRETEPEPDKKIWELEPLNQFRREQEQ